MNLTLNYWQHSDDSLRATLPHLKLTLKNNHAESLTATDWQPRSHNKLRVIRLLKRLQFSKVENMVCSRSLRKENFSLHRWLIFKDLFWSLRWNQNIRIEILIITISHRLKFSRRNAVIPSIFINSSFFVSNCRRAKVYPLPL